MNKNTLVLTTLLIALMALAILPVQGFHHPSTTDDLLYERYGPRADQVLMKIYGDYASEYLAFQAQEIDLMDWPLAAGDYNWLETNDPTHEFYNAVGYADFGGWEVDINNQQYPTDLLSVRQALSYLVDKRYFINTYIGSTVAVKADSPTEHLSAWYNPYCDDLYNQAPRTTVLPFPDDLIDFQAARNLLHDDLGACIYPCPVCGSTDHCSWLWPAKPVDPHGYVNRAGALLVFARSEDPNRANLGAFLKSTLEVDLPNAQMALGYPPNERCMIHVDLYTVPRAECKREAMGEYRYHLYTGGWGLTRDPDNLAFCYGTDQVWKPIYYAPNYPCYTNPLFDEAWDNAEMQATAAEAVPYVFECQKIIMDDAAIIPVWLTAGYKAYLSKWDGVVSMAGRGPHNFWTLLNARLRTGAGTGDTIRYGFMNDIASLSPIHASWVWDWYTMENIYDSLISFNPYNVAEDIPWMASWEIGTWDGDTKTKLTFHLRDDIVWQDVPYKADRKYAQQVGPFTGVPVTTKDVAFTMISIRDNLDAWNQFLVADVGKVEMNNAVLGVADGGQMLRPYDNAPMDVYGLSSVPKQDIVIYYNILSPWITLHWAGGLVILPYHIWYWVPWWDYDADGSIDTWLYDPEIEDTLYGSGPYIFDHRIPGVEILLKAYKVGTTYHYIASTGEYMASYGAYEYSTRVGTGMPPGFDDVPMNITTSTISLTKYDVQLPSYISMQIPGVPGGKLVYGKLYTDSTLFQAGYFKATLLGDVGNSAVKPFAADGKVDAKDLYFFGSNVAMGAVAGTAKWRNNNGWNVDSVGTSPTAMPNGIVDFRDLLQASRRYGCALGVTKLDSASIIGNTINVLHIDGFRIGGTIVVDAMGANPETRTITAITLSTGYATFTLNTALAYTHAVLAFVTG